MTDCPCHPGRSGVLPIYTSYESREKSHFLFPFNEETKIILYISVASKFTFRYLVTLMGLVVRILKRSCGWNFEYDLPFKEETSKIPLTALYDVKAREDDTAFWEEKWAINRY